MNRLCSLHCGYFSGVDEDSFAKNKEYLAGMFKYVNYDSGTGMLELTGAQDVPDDPENLTEIFNRLSTMINDAGKGRIMLKCDSYEICFFRRKAWKLEAIHVPQDPFDGIRRVD